MIPYGKQTIDEEDIKVVVETLKSDYLTTGPKVKEFEESIQKYLEVKYAVGCASGTDALILALKALGVGEGDEVITTPFTFFASASSIYRVGAKPVFADIKEDTFNIDPEKIEEKIRCHHPLVTDLFLLKICYFSLIFLY